MYPMNAATGSVHCPPKRKLKTCSNILCILKGASSQARHLFVSGLDRQLKLNEATNVEKIPEPVSAHLHRRTVNGKGRQGGRSASSSLRSTQNHTDATISMGASNNVK